MLRIFKYLLLGLMLTSILILLFAPRMHKDVQSIMLASPPQHIIPFLANPKVFTQWSPWTKEHYADYEFVFTGPTMGKDSKVSWTKNSSTTRTLEVKRVSNTQVDAFITLRKQVPSYMNFVLSEHQNKTEVTWSIETDLGFNPAKRFLAVVGYSLKQPKLTSGLLELKLRTETLSTEIAAKAAQKIARKKALQQELERNRVANAKAEAESEEEELEDIE